MKWCPVFAIHGYHSQGIVPTKYCKFSYITRSTLIHIYNILYNALCSAENSGLWDCSMQDFANWATNGQDIISYQKLDQH